MLPDPKGKTPTAAVDGGTFLASPGRGGRMPVIDLFAGAGGLSIGATDAGCEVRACVEIDASACRTLRANEAYHRAVLETDVAAITGLDLRQAAHLGPRDPLIVVGGAPCQPFSKPPIGSRTGKSRAIAGRARLASLWSARLPRLMHVLMRAERSSRNSGG